MQQAIDLGLELEVLLVELGALGKSEFILVREGVGFSKNENVGKNTCPDLDWRWNWRILAVTRASKI